MGVKNTLTLDGATSVISIKISPEMHAIIEKYSAEETRYNKSEMIRILLKEAIENREYQEKLVEEMARRNETEE